MGFFDRFKRSFTPPMPVTDTELPTFVEPTINVNPEPVPEVASTPAKPKRERKKPSAAPVEDAVAKPKRTDKKKTELTAKQKATKLGEPYVNIDRVIIDPNNPGQGGFELDWNEFFVAKLIKAGYAGKTDEDIVDQWFSDVCKNVALEIYEQVEANNPPRVNKRDLGNNRSEFS